MIIIEGPDGAGKSTLVDHLKKELGLVIGERGTKNRDELYKVTRQDTYTALATAVGGHGPVRIWDRLFFSEMVYAPTVGRDCEFSAYEQSFVRRILIGLACPIIVCLPPKDVVLANVADSEQMDGVHEGISKIYDQYADHELFANLPYVIYYDYTQRTGNGQYEKGGYQGLDAIVEQCKRYIGFRTDRSWA